MMTKKQFVVDLLLRLIALVITCIVVIIAFIIVAFIACLFCYFTGLGFHAVPYTIGAIGVICLIVNFFYDAYKDYKRENNR